MRKATRKSNWLDTPLGKMMRLEYGRSFPEKKRRPGPYAVYGSNGEIGRAHQYLLEEPTIIIGRKGSAGEINWAEAKSWPIDTTYFVNVTDGRVNSLDFIYYLLKWLDPRRFIDTTTKPGLNRDRVYEQIVPIPPTPVQERIAQILRKADDVRRKRQEAVDLTDAILSASFIGMFGDPENNLKAHERVPLGKIADIRSGVTKGRRLGNKETVEVPYLRVANVQDGFLDLTEMKTIAVLPDDVAKYHLEDGDILMTEGGDPDKLGRGAVWRNQVEGSIHQNHVFRVRANREKLAPEYLAGLLRTQYAKQYFLSCAKRSSNLASVNSTQVKAFSVPLPSIKLQEKFVSAAEQWVEASQRLTGGLKAADALFASLMDQAFSGHLTAEWEASNANWIRAQIEMHERLPRLLLLAFVRQRAARARRAAQATVLVTALMKYAFLFQMEGSARRRFYQFVPYHYGPFAKEIYEDLERLNADGLVTVDDDTDEDKTRIALADPAKADTALADIPDDLKEDIAAILDAYGDLDHAALLRTVYEKYPAYAKKSRIKPA